MEPNSTRPWPWAGALLALLVGALPTLAMLLLQTPEQWTGINAHRYQEHRVFWGGNPDEVFSHWLNMAVLSGNVTALSALVAMDAFMRRRHAQFSLWANATAVLTCLLSGGVGLWLDMNHGEGGALVIYPIGFAPVLLASYLLLRTGARRLRWRPLPVLGLCSCYALLQLLAQYCYEPSETGYPGVDFVLQWLGSLGVIGALLFSRRRARRYKEVTAQQPSEPRW